MLTIVAAGFGNQSLVGGAGQNDPRAPCVARGPVGDGRSRVHGYSSEVPPVIDNVHSCLEPRDHLLELGEREDVVNTDANGGTIERRIAYLFDIGLSLCAVGSLGLCVPAPLTPILRGERGARVVCGRDTARVTSFDVGDITNGITQG